VKRPIEALTEAQLERFPIAGVVDGWFFRVDERSIGCYVAEGTDRWRRRVSTEGGDAKRELAECVEAARSIQSQLDARSE